jgi:uncharacterized protein (TIGR02246 family)
MGKEAAALVEGAKKWATLYGDYPNGEEGAAYTAALRVRAAWEANDADAFADMFIDNGSMLVGDNQLVSRDEIRSYMAEAFNGSWRGSKLTEEPLEIRLLTNSVALAVTDGGILQEGEGSLPADAKIRGTWIIVKSNNDWRIASRQTSPIKG